MAAWLFLSFRPSPPGGKCGFVLEGVSHNSRQKKIASSLNPKIVPPRALPFSLTMKQAWNPSGVGGGGWRDNWHQSKYPHHRWVGGFLPPPLQLSADRFPEVDVVVVLGPLLHHRPTTVGEILTFIQVPDAEGFLF